MRGMLGADTARLRTLATRFGDAGELAARSGWVVAAQVAEVEWFGRDADAFRLDVDDVVRVGLDGLGLALTDLDDVLVRQADEQDLASAPRGATGSGHDSGGARGSQAASDVDAQELRELAGDPQAVNDVLAAAGDEAIERLAREHPDLVGPLEGAPYWARDLANRERLDEALRTAERSDSAHLEGLRQVRQTLDNTPGSSLPMLDLDDPDRVFAAIAQGNLDAAESVSYLVPGINNSVESTLPNLVASATNVRDEIALAGSGDIDDVATVAWMGYDSGDMWTVGGDALATDGAARLERTLNGFTAVRPDPTADLGVIGHSYGSTAVAAALSDGTTHGVDRFIAMGSAGFTEARDTNGFWPGGKEISPDDFGSTDVFITEASADSTADLGRVISGRLDPRDHGFTEFSSDASDGRPATTGHGHASTGDDIGYLGPGSNSLYNIGQILTGNADPGVDGDR